MSANPPPEGMTEEDYGTIHDAVVETVRGRWFLEEFARRKRMAEIDQVLSAIGRLENTVMGQKALPAPEAPHTRLLIQRAEEISLRLTHLVDDLRIDGTDERLCEELEAQARAIAGLAKPAELAKPVELAKPAELAPTTEPERALPEIAAAPVLQIEAPESVEPSAPVEPLVAQDELSPDEASFDEPPIVVARSGDVEEKMAAIAESLPSLADEPEVQAFACVDEREASFEEDVESLDLRFAALAAIDALTVREKLAAFA